MITELCPGVYTADHTVAEGKNGIVFTERGAIAIDVGLKPEEGRAMADFILERGFQPNRVILTHGHSDHVLGGEVFAEAEVYAHSRVIDEIRTGMKRYAQAKDLSYEDVLAGVLWPTVTFRDELFMNMGDKRLHLFPTPGHSADHTSVYVEEDRVLFAGDTIVTGIVPAIFYDSEALEKSLEKIADMAVDILVAGHGPVLHGSDAIHDWLRWELSYLRNVRAFVRDELQREPTTPSAEVAQRADFDSFIEGRLPPGKFGMVRRHQNTVVKICDEQRERLNLAAGGG